MNIVTSKNDLINISNNIKIEDKHQTLNFEINKEVIHGLLGKSYGAFHNKDLGWTIEKPDFQRNAQVHDMKYSCDIVIAILLGIYKPRIVLWYNLETKQNQLSVIDGQNKMKFLYRFMELNEITIPLAIFDKSYKNIVGTTGNDYNFPARDEISQLIESCKLNNISSVSYASLKNYPTIYENVNSPYLVEILSSYRDYAVAEFIKLNENLYAHTPWNLLNPFICQTQFFKELDFERLHNYIKIDDYKFNTGFKFFATFLQNKKSFGEFYESNDEFWYKINLMFYDSNVGENKMFIKDVYESKEIHKMLTLNKKDFHKEVCKKFKSTNQNVQFMKDLWEGYQEFFRVSFSMKEDYFQRLSKQMDKCIMNFVKSNNIPGKDIEKKYLKYLKLNSNEEAVMLLFVITFSYYYKNRNRKEISFSKILREFYNNYINKLDYILQSNSDDIISVEGDSYQQKADVMLLIYNFILNEFVDMKYNSSRLFTPEQRSEYCNDLFEDTGLDFAAHNFLYYDFYLNEVYTDEISCDHAVAHNRGGQTNFENFIPVSLQFNSEKQDRHLCNTPAEYFNMCITLFENLLKNPDNIKENNVTDAKLKLSIQRCKEAMEKYNEKVKEK